jgi:KDO2-lipid IV(A) lauroyltransferase
LSKERLHAWRVIAVDTLLYRAIVLLISLLPGKLAFAAARRLGRSKYRRLRPTLGPQAENMQRRLEAAPKQVEEWLQRSYELEACEYLDGCLFRLRGKERVLGLTEIRGLENLASALSSNKGAILYSGHVRGNFTFFAALGLLGFKPNPVRLQLRSIQHPVRRWFSDRFNRMMERKFGCRFLWTQPDTFGLAVQAANALRRNEVVNILIDLSFSAENVDVDFLGGPARSPVGPLLLAQATGAPLLDYYVYRTDEWSPQIVEIGPPIHVSDDPAAAAQHCASRLETQIRKHPADWGPWLIEDWNLFATWGEESPWTFLEEATNRA